MHCANCGAYYKLSAFNSTDICDDCLGEPEVLPWEVPQDFIAEVEMLRNPSGRTLPVFYDE